MRALSDPMHQRHKFVSGWVGLRESVDLARAAGACAASPPVRTDRFRLPRTRWVVRLCPRGQKNGYAPYPRARRILTVLSAGHKHGPNL
jgi:hypothetical protein